MSAAKANSWRNQLSSVRKDVIEAEKEREIRKKMEAERSRDALGERLAKDTPEAIANRFNDLKKNCQQAGRKLYPPEQLRAFQTDLVDLQELIHYYEICKRSHPDLFTTPMRQAMARIQEGTADLLKSITKQLDQWEGVEKLIDATAFRSRTDADNAPLIDVAKSFSLSAYGMPLSLPNDYFATERENFWVADADGTIYAYVKYWSADNAISFAVAEPEGVNWRKLLRAFLFIFCARGPVAEKLDAINVRLSDPSEFKFYQDLGLRRTGGLTSPVCTLSLD